MLSFENNELYAQISDDLKKWHLEHMKTDLSSSRLAILSKEYTEALVRVSKTAEITISDLSSDVRIDEIGQYYDTQFKRQPEIMAIYNSIDRNIHYLLRDRAKIYLQRLYKKHWLQVWMKVKDELSHCNVHMTQCTTQLQVSIKSGE